MIDTSHLSDVQVVACTLYGEARSEAPEGILAVACVIRNRVQTDLGNDDKPDWWGEGFRGVCLKAKQFSVWNDGPLTTKDATGKEFLTNHGKLAKLVESLQAGPVEDKRFQECAWIATGVVNDWVRDTVKGCNHYHTVQMQPRPDWARNIAPVLQVKNHVFYVL